MNTRLPYLLISAFLVSCCLVAPILAAEIGTLPNFDKRRESLRQPATLDATRESAAARLRAWIPAVRIEVDEVLVSPVWVYSTQGFLTGPTGEDEIIPRTAQATPRTWNEDSHWPVKRFLDENANLYGYGAGILTNARISREFVTEHNGMRTIVWEQQLDGIPIFEAVLYGHITKNGELVNLCSQFVPLSAEAADAGVPNRLAIQTLPQVSSQEAVAAAAVSITETMSAEEVTIVDASPVGAERSQRFKGPAIKGEAMASLVWLPMDRNTMRLCWRVILTGRMRSELFQVLVDAQSAEPQIRQCWTSYFTPQRYRVFTSDSPSPFSPGHASPSDDQPLLLGDAPVHGRQWFTNSAPTIASPNGWINDGGIRTIGNNVDAHTDLFDDDPGYGAVLPFGNPPRPENANRVFDYPMDLSQPPSTTDNRNAAVVNAFYWCNWMHDRLYDLGFTEATANCQQDNFGRGGVGGDAVIMEVQNGASLSPPLFNAGNYSVAPADGSGFPAGTTPPRISLFLWNGPDPDREGVFDAEVLLHEYTHLLSERRVGQGVGISANQSKGLAEGWSDFFALALLGEAGDNEDSNYPYGAYSTFRWTFNAQTLEQNYYFGMRHFPYSTDMSKNPLAYGAFNVTWPAEPYPGFDVNPVFAPGDFSSGYHAQGELWCVALWEARANSIDRYDFQAGNDLILRLVTDGMNLCPANPTFIQARDAVLQADLVYTGGANMNELWAAFARRGLGSGAVSPANPATTGVTESFALPPQGNQLWSYTTGNAVYSSPAIGPDGTIYVGSDDGRLYAFYPETGVKKWEFYEPCSPPQSFRSAPIVTPDGTIYARRSNGYLYAINSNGTLKWKVWVSYDSYVSPVLGPDGTIYVAGYTDLKAISPQGAILWTFPTGNTIYSSPAIARDGTIYFGGMDTKVYAVDPSTHLVKSGWPVVTGGYVASSPAIGPDGTVYVGSADGKLYALNPNGTHKWPPITLGSGSAIESSPAVGPDGAVYVGSLDYKVYSINPDTGQINSGWPFVTGHFVRSSPAIAADGTIFIGSYDGKLYALNPDGTAVGAPWPFNAGGAVFSSPVIGAGGTVYVGSGNGKLYALSGVSGPARSSWPMFRHNPWHTGNPATLTLASGVRLGDLDFQFQLRGLSGMNCTVEAPHNLESWSPLDAVTLPAGGVTTFTDTQASGYSHRFYRVRSDSILSYNSLGYMAVGVPSGSSMVANQLDNPAGNTVGVLLPNPPEGTTLLKWHEGNQQFVSDTFASGAWSDPNMTLNPGEGALVQSGTATTFTFVGELRQVTLANPYPSSLSIRSSMVPQTGPLDTALGFQPVQGDGIQQYNNTAGNYDTYTYFAGAWIPAVPVPRLGESFWINGSGSTWTRTFSIW